MVLMVNKEKEFIEKQMIDGLSKDDWELTLSQLKSQVVAIKLQASALKGSIAQVEGELKKYD